MLENFKLESQQSFPPVKHPSPPAITDLADLLVAYLEQLGVEYVFGVPGGAIEPIYNAISRNLRRGGTLSPVVARHEAGAAFMADGYARETGKIGVCVATTGPGATNMLTAVATAYCNGIPMLAITGQSALPSFGKLALQESTCTGVDIIGMFRHCTRYNSLVSHPQQLEIKLAAAIQHATRSPSGPAHLSIPVDILRTAIAHMRPAYDLNALLHPPALVDLAAIQMLLAMLAQARQPVILLGGGCGDSIQSILQFAVLKEITFVSTPDGKGLVSPQHPLYRGVFGFAGHAIAEAALSDPSTDLIIAVGTRMGEWETGGWSSSLLNDRLVHIDDSDEHLIRTPMARSHMRGNLRAIFDHLIQCIQVQGQQYTLPDDTRMPAQPAFRQIQPADSMLDEPAAFHSNASLVKPQRLMKELGSMFPYSTRFLAEAGNSFAWATHYLQPPDRRLGERRCALGDRPRNLGKRRSTGGWLRLTSHFAPMGWAIGAAIGTAAANPHAPVVCITGDGSFLMSGQELSVAVAEQLCVIFVILNDQALGMVKHGQRLGGAEQVCYTLPQTDFAAIARAQGGRGYTIHTLDDLLALDVKAICNYPGPTLLDVHIDGEEVPPIASRLRVLLDEGQS